MSQSSTIYNFDVELADSDRGVYEIAGAAGRAASVRVRGVSGHAGAGLPARVHRGHRVLARAVAIPDEPAIAVRDLTGALRAWIDIGTPDAARLHKASKAGAARRGLHAQGPGAVARNLAGERIHRAEALELYAIDRALIAALASRLERRMAFSLSVNDRELYLSLGAETLTGAVVRHSLV